MRNATKREGGGRKQPHRIKNKGVHAQTHTYNWTPIERKEELTDDQKERIEAICLVVLLFD